MIAFCASSLESWAGSDVVIVCRRFLSSKFIDYVHGYLISCALILLLEDLAVGARVSSKILSKLSSRKFISACHRVYG